MPQSKSLVPSVLVAVSGTIVNVAAAFAEAWTAYRHRRAVNSLLYFDDRMLADIGVTRGDVVASLSGGPLDDASSRLDALARERREGKTAQRREILAETRRTPPSDGGLRICGGVAVLDRAAA